MNRGARRVLLLSLALAGCARQGYIAVTVKLGALAGKIDRLELEAFDSRGDAGPLLIPAEGPVAAGLPNNSLVAVTTPLGNSLTVLVDGLGLDGGILGIGSATVASATANTRISVTLAPPCSNIRDCDPDGVCLGTIACTLGTCQTVTDSFAAAGAPCGPSDGGQCNGTGACVLPYCGTGLQPLPPDEQCDEGVAVNGNLPDHCRADCKLPSCGDGVVDPDAGELCDLGSRNGTGAGCNATCDLFGAVTILAGNGAAVSLDGIGRDAGFGEPGALAVIGGGLFVADRLTYLIRRIDLGTLAVTTIAGGFDEGSCDDTNGQGPAASFCLVTAMLAYNNGVGDGVIIGDVSALRYMTSGGLVSTLAGQLPTGVPVSSVVTGTFASSSYGGPLGLAFIPPVIYSSASFQSVIVASDVLTRETWVAARGESGGLTALGGLLYAGDLAGGVVAAVDPDAGTSVNVATSLQEPHGLCSDGRAVYIAEAGAQQVDELTVDGGVGRVSLLAGAGSIVGLGADAGFQQPEACAYDPGAHVLYVSDLKANLVFAIH